jgi:thioredoxin reductase (NADPH)
MSDPIVHNVVIIGSGPAGWTAALYTARAQLKPVVFEGAAPNTPGGQLMTTSDVENYPGFPEAVTGPELMERFKKQAERFGCEIRTENVVKLDASLRPHGPFVIHGESGVQMKAKAVIVSTGATAKLLGIPREKELIASGAGVSACATCDGAFYRGVEVAVVGGGDTAMEEALFLTRFASKVTIIHRREEFRASKIMLDRAKNHPKIAWELNCAVDELITEKKGPFNKDALVGVTLKSTKDGSKKNISIEGLFVAIGHAPNVELFRGLLDMDDKGYLFTHPKSTKTNVEGIFACGDVQDSYYRQAITAAGTGCMAAIDAERWLAEHDHAHHPSPNTATATNW